MPKKRKIESEGLNALSISGSTGVSDDARRPLAHVVLNSTNDYIVDLAHHSEHDLIGAASSTGVAVLSLSNNTLTKHHQPNNTSQAVSSVRFDPQHPAVLLSSSMDGCVRAWDTTAHVCSLELRDPENAELNCLDKQDHLVAAGSDGVITFWDDRKPDRILQRFEDTHEKRVTQVLFHPDQGAQKFFSASEDGLISVFSTANGLDEDDGFEAALNLMDSVAKMDFFGEERQRLWCSTSTENFYLWEWEAACREDADGGEGPFASCQDVRQQLNPGCGEEVNDSELSTILGLSESPDGRLVAASGACDGSFALVPVRPREGQCKLKTAKMQRFQGGHSAVVRSLLWPNTRHHVIITGGEDGRIAVWPTSSPTAPSGGKRKL